MPSGGKGARQRQKEKRKSKKAAKKHANYLRVGGKLRQGNRRKTSALKGGAMGRARVIPRLPVSTRGRALAHRMAGMRVR